MPLIQIKLINGEPMGRPKNPFPEFISPSFALYGSKGNPEWAQFERTVTSHPVPGCSESDGVEAVLQWQELFAGTWHTLKSLDERSPVGRWRQIWVLSQKVEVKEVDINTINFSEMNGNINHDWQLCPKCNGTNRIWNQPLDQSTTAVYGYIPCDLCDGYKVISKQTGLNPGYYLSPPTH